MNQIDVFGLLCIDASLVTINGEPMEDSMLISQIQNGDAAAFDMIYEKYKEKIYRTACLLCGNSADGDDISQETWISAYRNIKKLKNPESFVPYLYSILKRCAFKRFRKRKLEIPTETLPEFDIQNVSSPLSEVLQREKSREVSRAILSLEKRQRMVVILYYYNEFSIDEISAIMNAPPGTVKSRLHSARNKLSSLILKEDFYE